MQKTSSQKAKVVAAKIPATTESEIEVSPSATASELSTQVASQIRGEECSADFGGPPRLTLVAALSGLAEVIPPGHWALNNGIGAPVNLGAQSQILPLAASRAWLLDFGQEEGGGVLFASNTSGMWKPTAVLRRAHRESQRFRARWRFVSSYRIRNRRTRLT